MFLKSFRLLLFPFTLVYSLVARIRNLLYDRGWLPSTRFNVPVICVGNLCVGGTGKSPMVEFLLAHLTPRSKVATLSRGYRRRTRGYILAGSATTALEIGDEPMQFHRKFPEVAVCVGEKRVEAVPQLLYDRPETEVIVLDDAFQHRSISAGLNILLTDYSNLYTRDFFLPAGDLRDSRQRASKADVIIVTKCPVDLTNQQAAEIRNEINPKQHQSLFFTSITYDIPYRAINRTPQPLEADMEALLICGIANPDPLKRWLEKKVSGYEMMKFRDHHIFNVDDLREIRKHFQALRSPKPVILTTEKDMVRLEKFGQELQSLPILVLPIKVGFLFGGETAFRRIIDNFIDKYSDSSVRNSTG
jgi:tetraacyldisaccharide 4'-kinase